MGFQIMGASYEPPNTAAARERFQDNYGCCIHTMPRGIIAGSPRRRSRHRVAITLSLSRYGSSSLVQLSVMAALKGGP
jgi:hypothetical protein